MSALRDVLKLLAPLAVLIDGLATGLDTVFLLLDPLLTFGELAFTPMVIVTGQIAPEVGFLDQETMTLVTVFVATLYVVSLVRSRYKRFKSEVDES